MKKYEQPELIEVKVEIDDIVADSNTFGDNQAGDFEAPFPFF